MSHMHQILLRAGEQLRVAVASIVAQRFELRGSERMMVSELAPLRHFAAWRPDFPILSSRDLVPPGRTPPKMTKQVKRRPALSFFIPLHFSSCRTGRERLGFVRDLF